MIWMIKIYDGLVVTKIGAKPRGVRLLKKEKGGNILGLIVN